MAEDVKIANEKLKRYHRGRKAAWYKQRLEETSVVTQEEIANGWTDMELKRYVKERDDAVSALHGLGGIRMGPHKSPPIQGSDHYDPLDW